MKLSAQAESDGTPLSCAAIISSIDLPRENIVRRLIGFDPIRLDHSG
jgi:hypothetical protein